jgi:hypothetical protein
MSKMTFHERFGEISVAQLRAYKKYNVSQSDHDALVRVYGENRHQAITQAVRDGRNQTCSLTPYASFSLHMFYFNLQNDY